ncbi:unnamed protein product, partial [Brassica oleracea]
VLNIYYILGRLFLNATSGTHFYFDNNCEATRTRYQLFYKITLSFQTATANCTTNCWCSRVCGTDAGSSSAPTKYGGVKKIESITLSELNTHILTASPE